MVPDAPPWLLLVMLGAMVPIFAHHIWLWRVNHEGVVHAWAAAWVGTAALFFVGCLVQQEGTTVAVHVGERLQDASVALLLPCALYAVAALFRRSVPRWVRLSLVIGTLACLVLLSFTGLIVGSAAVEHRSLSGAVFRCAAPGPLYPLFLAYATTMGVVIFRTLRTSRVEVWSSRRVTLALIGLFIALGLNDALITMGLVRTTRLLHFGFFGLAIAMSYVANRRVVALYADMEGVVAERTRALRDNEHELEQLVERLRSSESRFRSLSDATSEAVFFHADGRITDVNAAGVRMFGAGAGDLVGQELVSLFPGAPIDGSGASSEEDLQRVARRQEGSTFPAEISRGSVADRDSQILTVRDVTEQQQMQARMMLADRVASLGTLAAGAAHEINNPLTYVLASLELLKDGLESRGDARAADPELVELVREALHGCKRVAGIVRELRSLSRGDDSEREPVRVIEAIESAIRMTRSETNHRARLVRDFEGDPRVLANPGRLGQVLVNLLINAAQAIPEGASESHEIRVSVRASSPDSVIVEVSDTGVGIPEDFRARIFDPFVTSKPIGQGTGLGLSICHSIVSALGGTIDVRSEQGRGSTFRVKLPAIAEVSQERSSRTELVRTAARTRLRVLIVDDEAMVAQALARMLRDHETTVVASGMEGLELLRNNDFELVLCDLMMPDVSGVDLYESVATIKPEVAARIVFVSGGAFTERARAFLESVPNARLDKPFTVAEVRRIVDEACEYWATQSEGVGRSAGGRS